MDTVTAAIDPVKPDAAIVAQAAAMIRAGGLVAFPTETVYGLGADATNPAAVERIFAAKGRDRDDPLIVHLAGAADLDTVARDVPPLSRLLGEAFWPGPLTIVLPRHSSIAPGVSAGLATVAVRVPRHAVARALIVAAGVPIAAPSANRFMRTSPTTAAHVLGDLDGRVELVLDGGPTEVGVESTVVVVDGDDVRILRPGGVTKEALVEALATLAPDGVVRDGATGQRIGPGMLSRHYAPATTLVLITGARDAVAARLRERLGAERQAGRPVALLGDDDLLAGIDDLSARASLGAAGDTPSHARRLFAAMRDLDASGAAVILAAYSDEGGLAAAVRDRLRRAASEVIEAPTGGQTDATVR